MDRGEYDISADDLLSQRTRAENSFVKEFLKEVLESGFVAQTKVAEEAGKQGKKRKHYGMRRRN